MYIRLCLQYYVYKYYVNHIKCIAQEGYCSPPALCVVESVEGVVSPRRFLMYFLLDIFMYLCYIVWAC